MAAHMKNMTEGKILRFFRENYRGKKILWSKKELILSYQVLCRSFTQVLNRGICGLRAFSSGGSKFTGIRFILNTSGVILLAFIMEKLTGRQEQETLYQKICRMSEN